MLLRFLYEIVTDKATAVSSNGIDTIVGRQTKEGSWINNHKHRELHDLKRYPGYAKNLLMVYRTYPQYDLNIPMKVVRSL